MNKYKMVNEPRSKYYRILALVDIGDIVKKGQVGGLVSSESNLSQEGLCWIWPDAKATGASKVIGDAQITNQSSVSGTATVGGRATLGGRATVGGNATIDGNAYVGGMATIGGSSVITDNAYVVGAATLNGHTFAIENARIGGHICLGGGEIISTDIMGDPFFEEKHAEKIRQYRQRIESISKSISALKERRSLVQRALEKLIKEQELHTRVNDEISIDRYLKEKA